MLYAIRNELEQAFKAQKVPVKVVYAFGSEPTKSVSEARERVVLIEPIGNKRDKIESPVRAHLNPKHPALAVDAFVIRIYARSNLPAATPHDHAARARQIRQHVVSELDAIVRIRQNQIEWGAAGFIEPVDGEGSTVWSGALYEMDLTIDRGTPRVTWAGDAAEEVTIGTDVTIVNTTKVRNAPGAGDGETAVGG